MTQQESQLIALEAQVSQLKSEKGALEQVINELKNRNHQLQGELEEMNNKCDELREEKEELEEESNQLATENTALDNYERNYPEPPDDIAKEEKLSLFYEYSKCFSFEELNAMFKDAYWKKENNNELPKSYTK